MSQSPTNNRRNQNYGLLTDSAAMVVRGKKKMGSGGTMISNQKRDSNDVSADYYTASSLQKEESQKLQQKEESQKAFTNPFFNFKCTFGEKRIRERIE